ncbi:unnamed protein product [Linum trigynum]|uniref:Uncharacterized protein n=1 Tax=Linum trigynum TaxID=586398 RepID=A0AAV2FZX6_9ROSI
MGRGKPERNQEGKATQQPFPTNNFLGIGESIPSSAPKPKAPVAEKILPKSSALTFSTEPWRATPVDAKDGDRESRSMSGRMVNWRFKKKKPWTKESPEIERPGNSPGPSIRRRRWRLSATLFMATSCLVEKDSVNWKKMSTRAILATLSTNWRCRKKEPRSDGRELGVVAPPPHTSNRRRRGLEATAFRIARGKRRVAAVSVAPTRKEKEREFPVEFGDEIHRQCKAEAKEVDGVGVDRRRETVRGPRILQSATRIVGMAAINVGHGCCVDRREAEVCGAGVDFLWLGAPLAGGREEEERRRR